MLERYVIILCNNEQSKSSCPQRAYILVRGDRFTRRAEDIKCCGGESFGKDHADCYLIQWSESFSVLVSEQITVMRRSRNSRQRKWKAQTSHAKSPLANGSREGVCGPSTPVRRQPKGHRKEADIEDAGLWRPFSGSGHLVWEPWEATVGLWAEMVLFNIFLKDY